MTIIGDVCSGRCEEASPASTLQEWMRAKCRSNKRVFLVEVPVVDIQAKWEVEMRGWESLLDRVLHYTTQWEAREEA
jgi:hypothetical protein